VAGALGHVPPPIEKSAALDPLKLSLSVTGSVWLLVMVTLFAAVEPNFTLPNTELVLEVLRPPIPVPESATCCGLVVALSLIVSVASCDPSEAGLNATPSVQDFRGATLTGIAPQVPCPFNAYSGSEVAALETISWFLLPLLDTVTVLGEVVPTATLPKASGEVTDIEVVGVAVGVGVTVAVAVAVEVAVAVAVAVGVAVAVEVAVAVSVAVWVGVAVAEAVGVAVVVAVAVEDAVGVALTVGVAVAVGVAVVVAVAVADAVGVAVTVGVAVAVEVVVAVDVAVEVAVAVRVAVAVAVALAVAVAVAVAVEVLVAVGVAVAVDVGVGVDPTTATIACDAWLLVVATPVTVNVSLPRVAPEFEVRVSVDDAPAVTDGGTKAPVTPDGKPITASVTLSADPDLSAVETV
jgi:hypothetical protein